MSAAATAIASWVTETPFIDGVLFGSSDGEVQGPPVCAVAVAGAFRGYGKGHTQSQALASAVGEALEQVAAQRVDPALLRLAPFEEIAAEAFDPRWLGLYSTEQYNRSGFPFCPFYSRVPLHWLEGRWIDTGERVYLPAFAVFLSAELFGEALCQVTSNGLAAGPFLSDAVERAVLELHERDAFLSSWRALLPKRRVSIIDRSGIIAHLQSRGADIEVYELTESPVCVAAAVAIGDGKQWPAYTLGLGAARHIDEAVDKAILELGQTSPYLARLFRRAEVPLPRTPLEIKTLQDHSLYYCDPAHRSEFERWLDTPQGFPVASVNPRIAVANITPRELQDSPYRIVRALGRGIQSLYYGYGFQRLTSLPSLNAAPCPIC
jgi:ribosomal protein S12 methylthiotransferase accessory factor